MRRSKFTDGFDLDVTLRDAALDPETRPERRAIANVAIGMAPDDAYYSVRELREAVAWVHEGVAGGRTKLAAILGNLCDDYQRAIFYNLAGRGIVVMLDDLLWLERLLEARGRIAGAAARGRVPTAPLPEPYVADVADGPVGRFDDGFELGPSWWLEPSRVDAANG